MQYTVSHQEKGKVEVKVDVPKAGFDTTYNKILNETASFLISKHLGEIFQKENLVPLASPKIAISSLSKNSPFVFTASFTQKTQVTICSKDKRGGFRKR